MFCLCGVLLLGLLSYTSCLSSDLCSPPEKMNHRALQYSSLEQAFNEKEK